MGIGVIMITFLSPGKLGKELLREKRVDPTDEDEDREDFTEKSGGEKSVKRDTDIFHDALLKRDNTADTPVIVHPEKDGATDTNFGRNKSTYFNLTQIIKEIRDVYSFDGTNSGETPPKISDKGRRKPETKSVTSVGSVLFNLSQVLNEIASPNKNYVAKRSFSGNGSGDKKHGDDSSEEEVPQSLKKEARSRVRQRISVGETNLSSTPKEREKSGSLVNVTLEGNQENVKSLGEKSSGVYRSSKKIHSTKEQPLFEEKLHFPAKLRNAGKYKSTASPALVNHSKKKFSERHLGNAQSATPGENPTLSTQVLSAQILTKSVKHNTSSKGSIAGRTDVVDLGSTQAQALEGDANATRRKDVSNQNAWENETRDDDAPTTISPLLNKLFLQMINSLYIANLMDIHGNLTTSPNFPGNKQIQSFTSSSQGPSPDTLTEKMEANVRNLGLTNSRTEMKGLGSSRSRSRKNVITVRPVTDRLGDGSRDRRKKYPDSFSFEKSPQDSDSEKELVRVKRHGIDELGSFESGSGENERTDDGTGTRVWDEELGLGNTR